MIELIVGGARSGKSGYALNQAQANVQTQISNRQLSFIATAEARDGEMQSRIERHQQERDSSWSLIEEPQNLSNLINQFSDDDVVLVDCLTLWLTNWLCSKTPELESELFTFAYLNIRGYTSHEAELSAVTEQLGDPTFIGLVEIFLKKSVKQIHLPVYLFINLT